MRVLVLGGYGNFGARIARALAHNEAIDLVIAGRDAAKAKAVAASLDASAECVDAASPDLAERLASLGAQLVIHTAGPFQDQDYAVPLAAAAAGSHYIDLADSRRFVCDFAGVLDGVFRRAGRIAVTGASTVPALSSAVIDDLRPRFGRLDAIETCIGPAQQAPRGVATLAGVLSYCGSAIPVWKNGGWHEQVGWSAPVPVRFARMKPRLGSLCDIPDLELLPVRYPDVRDVMFRAALEVSASQRAFALIAWLKRCGLLRRPGALAPALQRFSTMFDSMGSALGGMVVNLRGADACGQPLQLSWHIAADNNHGPEIPCMAAILLARRIAAGEAMPAGASACMGFVKLAEFSPEFERWGMRVDVEEAHATAGEPWQAARKPMS